jgi:hypothetical protein
MATKQNGEDKVQQGQVEQISGGNGGKGKAAHRKMFDDLDSCKEVQPESDKMRIFEVLKDGMSIGYTWANTGDSSIVVAAKEAGYSARVAEPKGTGPLTNERAAAKLADLTDEELAALGLKRAKGKK